MSLFESVPLGDRNTDRRRTVDGNGLPTMPDVDPHVDADLDADLQSVESSLRRLPLAGPSHRLAERMQLLFEPQGGEQRQGGNDGQLGVPGGLGKSGQVVLPHVNNAGSHVGFGSASSPGASSQVARSGERRETTNARISRLVFTAVACLNLGFIVGLSSDRLGRSSTTERKGSFQSAAGVGSLPSGGGLVNSVGSGGHRAFSVSLKGSDSTGADSLLLALTDAEGQPIQTDQAGKTPWQRTRWWEQQSGDSFSVATHVSDARFDFCRLCHLAASNMATDGSVR